MRRDRHGGRKRVNRLVPTDFAQMAQKIEERLEKLLPGDDEERIRLLDRLTDCYERLERFDAAADAAQRAISPGCEGEMERRGEVAGLLLQAGRTEQAAAIYEDLRAQASDATWIYDLAGEDYEYCNEFEEALRWYTDGLRMTLRSEASAEEIIPFVDARRGLLRRLGLPEDDLMHWAQSVVENRRFEDGGDAWGPGGRQPTRTLVGVAWFPPDEFERALALWPELKEALGEDTYEGYARHLERSIKEACINPSYTAGLAPIDIDKFQAWCHIEGLDPGSREARIAYGVGMAKQRRLAPWPPGRNDPCWCRSGKKYKRCCGGQ